MLSRNARLLILLCMVGCKSPNEPNQSPLAQDFMPLKVGNLWRYQMSYPAQGIDTVRVTSIVSVNGKSYFKLSAYGPWSFFFLRTDGPRLFSGYQLTDTTFTEAYIADFSFEVNQSVDFVVPGTTSRLKQQLTLISKSDTTFTFSIDDPSASDDGFTITYRKGIGMTDVEPGYGVSQLLLDFTLY